MDAPHSTPRLRSARCPGLVIALVAAAAFGACGGHSSAGTAGTAGTPAPRAVEAAEAAAAVDRLGWMVGCWERRGGDLRVEEQWMAPSGGTMTGVGRTVRAGRTVQREPLRIEARSGRLVYVASPFGQATTEFTATAVTDTLAVFDNPAHDHFMNAGLADSPERLRAELRRMLYGGVTLARDANGDARLLAVLQRSLRMGAVVGPDIYYAAHMSGPDFIARDRRVGRASAGFRRGEPAWMQVVTRETDVAWAVGRAAGTHATGLKLYVGVDAVSHLCWLAWQDEDLDPAANVPFTHTSYPEPRPSFDPALVEPDSPEMTLLFREMADRGTLLDATHSAYASGAGSTRGCTPELTTGLARAAHRAGVPFVTGTDYYVDAHEPFPSVHREIEYLVDQRVLSPLEAITAATLNGARLLDLADTHGSIAPGMAASLVVLAEDPSVDIRALRSVVTVLHRGEWYPRDTRTLSP